MAAFELEVLKTHPLDYRLSGAPALFWRLEVLRESTGWLEAHAYEVVTLSAAGWGDSEQMHSDFASALNFPSYYGRNLDALDDCLSEVATGGYGSSFSSTGLVLVLTGFDAFSRDAQATAQTVVEILDRNARHAMLFGRRVLVLIQSDDPELVIDPIGARSVGWNPVEWHESARRM